MREWWGERPTLRLAALLVPDMGGGAEVAGAVLKRVGQVAGRGWAIVVMAGVEILCGPHGQVASPAGCALDVGCA